MNPITIMLVPDSQLPLYQQLYNHFANEIKNGSIREHEKLPSKRLLASHLKISISTVESAYSMLFQEGYIKSVPKSGYYACPLDDILVENKHTLSSKTSPPNHKEHYKSASLDTDFFPYATWSKLLRNVLCSTPNLLNESEGKGVYALRLEIAKYLHEFRGVKCSPEQIIVGAGTEYLLMLLVQLLGKENTFALENPGYPKLNRILLNLNRPIQYVDVDNMGMDIDALEKSNASIAYVTPSCQFPTSVVMPIGRRLKLLNWANQESGRFIIEDDYNTEFNLTGRPIPAIQGIDSHSKVIYISTFSRVLAPSIRIAYMVLPAPLLEIYNHKFNMYSTTVSSIDQHTLCHFMAGGHLTRHINRMKNIYRKKRDMVLAMLKANPCIELADETSGFNLPLKLSGLDTDKILDKANAGGYHLFPLNACSFTEKNSSDILIFNYASIHTEKIKEALTLLFG